MKTIIAFLMFTFTTQISFAGNLNERTTFRCPNGIVSIGNDPAAVLQKCGQPSYSLSPGVWVYDRGANEFIYILYVSNHGVWKIVSSNEKGKN